MAKKIDNTLHFRGKALFSNSKSQLLIFLETHLKSGKSTFFVFTPNPEQIVLAEHNEQFNQALKSADLLIPDGVGLVWASKILSNNQDKQLKERIAGKALVGDLLQIAEHEKLAVLVVGGHDYSKTNKIEVGGLELDWVEGYKDILHKKTIEEEILQKKIEELKPQIVFVAFGAPWQEKWILDHRELLIKNGVKLAMAVGGSFDYLLGRVPVPPVLIEKLGLEWLFRLISQPWRWKRQLKLVEFVWLVMKLKFTGSDLANLQGPTL